MYRHLIKPLLFKLDAETAHDFIFRFAEEAQQVDAFLALTRSLWGHIPEQLHQTIWGLDFPGPVGLAAGFDKNARLPVLLSQCGFGFLEIGSITAKPSPGNPRPRAFRLPADEALINRMGLNNDGADVVTARLQHTTDCTVPVGINIAKTHDHTITGDAATGDYLHSFRRALPIAGYITVNISCPNTSDGKTFESAEPLQALLTKLYQAENPRNVPVLVKFSADIDSVELKELVGICESFGVDGYEAVNTSSSRLNLITGSDRLSRIGSGGLSGAPIRKQALSVLRNLREYTGGKKPLIGTGGIMTTEDAIERIRSGAWLLQSYTGLVYNGPGFVRRLNRGIADELEKRAMNTLAELRSAG
ncbi:MAG: quinone-dependent dihydroorotate dehydrogenase [Cyclonatronaceae bacterium]